MLGRCLRHGVYHCPHCDGWEHRRRPVAVCGAGEEAAESALDLLTWSRNVTLCTDGPAGLSPERRTRLRANGIGWIEDEIVRLEGGSDGMVNAVVFAGRAALPCEAVFFSSDCPQRSPLAENLGCQLGPDGSVMCNGHAATNVPGLYVAGNVRGGIHLAIVAAAEGAEAAIAINRALHQHDLR